jgi:hypothetical protein
MFYSVSFYEDISNVLRHIALVPNNGTCRNELRNVCSFRICVVHTQKRLPNCEKPLQTALQCIQIFLGLLSYSFVMVIHQD